MWRFRQECSVHNIRGWNASSLSIALPSAGQQRHVSEKLLVCLFLLEVLSPPSSTAITTTATTTKTTTAHRKRQPHDTHFSVFFCLFIFLLFVCVLFTHAHDHELLPSRKGFQIHHSHHIHDSLAQGHSARSLLVENHSWIGSNRSYPA